MHARPTAAGPDRRLPASAHFAGGAAPEVSGLAEGAFQGSGRRLRERVYRPIRDRYLQGEIFEKLQFVLSGEARRRVYSFIRPENARYRLSDKLEAAVEQLFDEEDDPDIPKDDYDEAMRQQSYPSAQSMHFAQPLYGHYPQMQPMYGQPMYGQPMYGQPIYGQPMYGQPMYAPPMYGQPAMAAGHYQPTFGPGPAIGSGQMAPQHVYVPIKKDHHGGLGAKISSNSNALLQSSQFSGANEGDEPYDLLLPPPETKKLTRAYKPIKPSNHPGGLSEKFSYNGQALLASEPQAVVVGSVAPVREEREERRLGYDGHTSRDGPNPFVEADSHYMQRMNDPPQNPFEAAHQDYAAKKQQSEPNPFEEAHEDYSAKKQQAEARQLAAADEDHQRQHPKEEEQGEERHREKREKKEKKEKRDKKDKKEKKDKKRKSEHRHADRSSADASLEKKEKKDRRDRTEDQDSDTHNVSINKTLDLRDKHLAPLALSPVQPDPDQPEAQVDLPLAHSHASRSEPPEDNADHLAKSNLESSAEKKTQIRVLRRPKKKPEKEVAPAGPSSQFPDAQTQDYHVRMRDRQAKLQEFLERKAQNHRAKLEQNKKRAEDRHQKLAGKPLWAAADKMHLDGNSRAVRPEHTLSLMFEGKSYEQYYRDKYFEEVLGMQCPEEFMAEKQLPTVVRPGFSLKSPVAGGRFRKGLSLSQQPGLNGPEFLGPALSIQEPVVIKYSTRPPPHAQDWENETMDRYRYFNQDRKDVKFIRSSRKQTINDALQLGASQPLPGPGFKESSSLKLPSLSKQKLAAASSKHQLNF